MTKKSYITILANDNYLKGVLVLNESLKKVKSKYPLTVFTGKNLSKKSKNILKKYKINIIEQSRDLKIPETLLKNNNNNGYDYWNNTFLKLFIFDLEQFEKLVFLDCDMLVLANIDELFNKPHMSYVPTEQFFDGGMGLNSGTMVIEPKYGYCSKMEELLNSQIFNSTTYYGDQTIINEYFKNIEKKEELHLKDGYNAQFGYIPKLIEIFNYSLSKGDYILKIIHFVGKKKPWMNQKRHLEHYFKYIIRRQWILFQIFIEYDKILLKINFEMLFIK